MIGLLILAGCGKQGNEIKSHVKNSGEANDSEIINDSGLVDDSGSGNDLGAVNNESVKDTNETALQSIDESSDTVKETETSNLSVINNNGHFVQIGDKVYFHIADADGFSKSSLWARYTNAECGRTVLMEYDLVSGEVREVSHDHTSGFLAVQGNYIYSQAYESTENKDGTNRIINVYSIENGEESLESSSIDMTLLGASTDGSYIVADHYEYLDSGMKIQFFVFKDKKLTNIYDVKGFLDFVKVGLQEAFYICDSDDEGYTLNQLNLVNGDIICLGKLPVFEGGAWSGTSDQCVIKDDNIYFTYSSYEGSGNFFTEGFFVQAKIGDADSLSYSEMPERIVFEENLASKFVLSDGQMEASAGEPGSCSVKEGGELGYYDENAIWQAVSKNWETQFLNEEDDYKGIELAEKVGNYIFVIYNENIRAPKDDIGWRYAYTRAYTNIYCVSIETGEVKLILRASAS